VQFTYFFLSDNLGLTLVAANSVTNGNVLCKRCSSDIDVSTTQVRTFT
jgi:kinesin family member C2/C3